MELVSLHLGFAAAPGFAHNWVTRLQQGRCGALLVLLSPTWPPKSHTGAHRAEFGFLSRTNSPLPLKGEGLDIACLGFVESALLVHNWGTLAQQGRSGGFGGVAPLLGPQNRTQGHTGASLVLACWLAILRKIAFRNPV